MKHLRGLILLLIPIVKGPATGKRYIKNLAEIKVERVK